MKKRFLVLGLLLGLALASTLWYYRFPERIVRYFEAPLMGKGWSNEVEKQTRLYPRVPVDYVFLGDSHMEQCEWAELFPEKRIANRGIGGETLEGLMSRLFVLDSLGSPVVFLQIGLNDALGGDPPDLVVDHYRQLLDSLERRKIHLVPFSIFPTRYQSTINNQVLNINCMLDTLFEKRGLRPLNLYPSLTDGMTLKADFTRDGIHLNARGYALMAEAIRHRMATASDSASR